MRRQWGELRGSYRRKKRRPSEASRTTKGSKKKNSLGEVWEQEENGLNCGGERQFDPTCYVFDDLRWVEFEKKVAKGVQKIAFPEGRGRGGHGN